jgi:hypothetical protein
MVRPGVGEDEVFAPVIPRACTPEYSSTVVTNTVPALIVVVTEVWAVHLWHTRVATHSLSALQTAAYREK